MIRLIIFTVIAVSLTVAHLTNADDKPAHIAYTENFLRLHPDRLKTALELMPLIEGHSAIHGIDPIVPAVVISLESSWYIGAVGKAGEYGLMQVHGACARGYDLRQVEQQIEAGIKCLAASRDACDGSLRQMLTMYASGSCVARTERTKRRISYRIKIIEKWSSR